MGSNLGPTNKNLIDRVRADVSQAEQQNPKTPVPVDLVTTSGSGLDPHISPQAALFQVPRVAKTRGVPEDRVRQLVESHMKTVHLEFLASPGSMFYSLNLALDQLPNWLMRNMGRSTGNA